MIRKIINSLEFCIKILESGNNFKEEGVIDTLIQARDDMVKCFQTIANLLYGMEETEREENDSSLGANIEKLDKITHYVDSKELTKKQRQQVADELFIMTLELTNTARHISETVFKDEFQKYDAQIAI
jgi:hypothetical protein